MTSRVSASKAAIQARRLPATWPGPPEWPSVRREVLYASTPVAALRIGSDVLDGQGLGAGEHLCLGGLKDAVEPAEQDERQDDSAVLGLLVVAAQQVGDGPDEARVIVDRPPGLSHAVSLSFPEPYKQG